MAAGGCCLGWLCAPNVGAYWVEHSCVEPVAAAPGTGQKLGAASRPAEPCLKPEQQAYRSLCSYASARWASARQAGLPCDEPVAGWHWALIGRWALGLLFSATGLCTPGEAAVRSVIALHGARACRGAPLGLALLQRIRSVRLNRLDNLCTDHII